ncbi:unnamed protein product [Caenorhabditis angaria]|uniref:Protein quiver n=1 Tax=Caenorhabditis angaria TaxID=860376 RepID=A0A9P1N7G8_9PELO|nr:unnamed protein product [Caenorhabditis angaria]
MPFFIFFIAAIFGDYIKAEKCYSCSSPQLHLKWPKHSLSNRLLYLARFPIYEDDNCETIRDAMPVVDCPNSVCIKAVIKEPPAERSVCETGGAIVRDCWSRVVDSEILFPHSRRDMVRLTESETDNSTIGIIYTCKGFLCNSSSFRSLDLSFLFFVISTFFGFL